VVGLVRVELVWVELAEVELVWVELAEVELVWVELVCSMHFWLRRRTPRTSRVSPSSLARC